MTSQEEKAAEYKKLNEPHSQRKTDLVGTLSAKYRHPGEEEWTDLGVVSEAIVTNAFIAKIVSNLRALGGGSNPSGAEADLTTMKYHDSGTAVVAENATDTTLGTPTGDARVAGTQTSTGAGNYRSVATLSYTSTLAITEHGVFSASTGGTLLDRSKFAAINVINGSQIAFTYDLSLVGS